jgi:hypothetical protein
MPERTAKANATKSKVRTRVKHVFARQRDQMGLFIRTIGIKRAEPKITLANLGYNMHRLIFHERRAAMPTKTDGRQSQGAPNRAKSNAPRTNPLRSSG